MSGNVITLTDPWGREIDIGKHGLHTPLGAHTALGKDVILKLPNLQQANAPAPSLQAQPAGNNSSTITAVADKVIKQEKEGEKNDKKLEVSVEEDLLEESSSNALPTRKSTQGRHSFSPSHIARSRGESERYVRLQLEQILEEQDKAELDELLYD